MFELKKLYAKQGRELTYFLSSSRNPFLLLRWCRFFFLNIAIDEAIFSNKIFSSVNFIFPDFMMKINQMLEAYKIGYPEHEVKYFETFRSNVRQKHLYDENVTKKSSFSMHYLGLAVDLTRWFNGSHKWSLDYEELRMLGNKIGLTNLYPFEYCHFQFIPCSMQNDFIDFAKHSIRVIQDLLNVKIDGNIGAITQGQILFNKERLEIYFNDCESHIRKELSNEC